MAVFISNKRLEKHSISLEVEDRNMQAVEWEQAPALAELDLTNTRLSADCLVDCLMRMQPLSWLSVSYCDHFNDKVSCFEIFTNQKL